MIVSLKTAAPSGKRDLHVVALNRYSTTWRPFRSGALFIQRKGHADH
jgi:hypothetical protein